MSLAADTREAVRERPFLLDALRAGVANHSAAATWLADDAGLNGETDAIATALRRFREDRPPYATEERTASVSMRSGVGLVEGNGRAAEGAADDGGGDSALLHVGDAAITPDGGATAVLATGDVDATALATVLRRLTAADVDPVAAGVAGESLIVVVGRREGATAVRVVEAALSAVPARES